MDLHEQLKYFYEYQRQQQQQQQQQQKQTLEKSKFKYLDRQNQQQINVKLPSNSQTNQPNNANYLNQTFQLSMAQVQKKIFRFIYIYAIIIVALYLTYAAYYFYQRHNDLQQHQQLLMKMSKNGEFISNQIDGVEIISAKSSQLNSSPEIEQSKYENKLETKIHLLERYIELIALDLQDTKNTLKEREKCDCSIGCSFNGTQYADNSSWQSQCDICSCKAGKISCVPRKCPLIQNCDVPITLPGQCCPSCMKKCKYNNTFYQHGQRFNPSTTTTTTASEKNHQTSKECRCDDGRIKCEQKLNPTMANKSQRVILLKPPTRIKQEPTQQQKQVPVSTGQFIINNKPASGHRQE